MGLPRLDARGPSAFPQARRTAARESNTEESQADSRNCCTHHQSTIKCVCHTYQLFVVWLRYTTQSADTVARLARRGRCAVALIVDNSFLRPVPLFAAIYE